MSESWKKVIRNWCNQIPHPAFDWFWFNFAMLNQCYIAEKLVRLGTRQILPMKPKENGEELLLKHGFW